MASPFPGVDPYLESQHRCDDFHLIFLCCLSEAMRDLLTEAYDARIDEREYYVRLKKRGWEEVRERFAFICEHPERSLVTVVEVLKPDDKTGAGRRRYFARREEHLCRGLHLVEVDMVLGGEALPGIGAGCDFHVLITRNGGTSQSISWNLRDSIPIVPIPLLEPDRDMDLDLGSIYSTAYERGPYSRYVDYSADLDVRLDEPTLRWANELGISHASACRAKSRVSHPSDLDSSSD